ncbi:MAG: hypothetical protein EBZ49_18475, partial [Proteobacteria bacterium]|nr:hypothetical protein [Pseudomonadota bacterium]
EPTTSWSRTKRASQLRYAPLREFKRTAGRNGLWKCSSAFPFNSINCLQAVSSGCSFEFS